MKQFLTIIKNSIEPLAESGVPIILQSSIEGILGQFSAGLVTFRISYKQKIFERNIKMILHELIKRQRGIAEKVEELSDAFNQSIGNTAFQIMLESCSIEMQKEKIELLVNGFESIYDEKVDDEELIYTYYDVLKNLRLAEIKRLTIFKPVFDRTNPETGSPIIIQNSNVTGYFHYIDKKLEQYGLIKPTVISGGFFDPSMEPNTESILTPFGVNFISFFKIKFGSY